MATQPPHQTDLGVITDDSRVSSAQQELWHDTHGPVRACEAWALCLRDADRHQWGQDTTLEQGFPRVS